ncbi:DUF2177 family protein [Chitinimonas naiadis]
MTTTVRLYALTWLVTLLLFLLLDAVWLGLLARDFYQQQLNGLLLVEPRWVPAALFYLLYTLGILLFVQRPLQPHDRTLRTGLLGAAFGLCAYGTYDLSNYATLPGWSWPVTVADMLWGAVATSLSAMLGQQVSHWRKRG